MGTIENIWAEIATSDGTVAGVLDSSPPLSTDECLLVQPVREKLLTRSGATELTHLCGELDLLPASGLDGTAKGSNVVRLFHSPDVTRFRVSVNKPDCFNLTSESCTVLHMPTTKRKPTPEPGKASAKKRVNDALVGPDGLTMGQRVIRLLEDRDVGQSELARMCSRYYSTFVPGKEDAVKQQHIFNIIQGQESSWVTPLIAAVFDVSDMWLQFGIGNMERKKN